MRINNSALPAVHEVAQRGEGEQHEADQRQDSELILHLKARHVYIPSEEERGREQGKEKQNRKYTAP